MITHVKPIAIALLTALLAACATQQPAPVAADRVTQHVACVPGRVDLCYAKAKQLCPAGYDEVKPENSVTAARSPASGATAAAAAPDATPTSLLIACR